jgi:hypothetical protein
MASWHKQEERIAARHRAMLNEAHELGERFPDLQNDEVHEFVCDVVNTRYNQDGLVARAIIIAYEGDVDAALKYLESAAFGMR